MHRHRPAGVLQHRTGNSVDAQSQHNERHQRDVHRCRSEDSGQSMAQPGLARHTVSVVPMRPGHGAGVAGHQEERGDGLEWPGQPLSPGLVDQGVLPTERSVVIGHRPGQPMSQHDEDHTRYAVEIHRKIAVRSRGVDVVHQRGTISMSKLGGRWVASDAAVAESSTWRTRATLLVPVLGEAVRPCIDRHTCWRVTSISANIFSAHGCFCLAVS